MAEKRPSRLTVSEALKRRQTKKKDFIEEPTDRDGVTVRYMEDNIPVVGKRSLAGFVGTAVMYARRKKTLDASIAKQKTRENSLKDFAATHDGIRGISSKNLKSRVNLIPQYSVNWVEDVLRKRAGPLADTILKKEIVVAVNLPVGHPTELGPLTPEMARMAAFLGFAAIGANLNRDSQAIAVNTRTTIDEAALHEKVEAGQVDVTGAGEVTETWALRVDPLRDTVD